MCMCIHLRKKENFKWIAIWKHTHKWKRTQTHAPNKLNLYYKIENEKQTKIECKSWKNKSLRKSTTQIKSDEKVIKLYMYLMVSLLTK